MVKNKKFQKTLEFCLEKVDFLGYIGNVGKIGGILHLLLQP